MSKKNDRFSASQDQHAINTLGFGTPGYLSVGGQGNQRSFTKQSTQRGSFGTLEDQILKWQENIENPPEKRQKEKEKTELEYWEDTLKKARMKNDSEDLITLPCLVVDPDWEPSTEEATKLKKAPNKQARRVLSQHTYVEYPIPNKYVVVKYDAWNSLNVEVSGGFEFSVYPVQTLSKSQGISMGRVIEAIELRQIINNMLSGPSGYDSIRFFVDWDVLRDQNLFLIDEVILGSRRCIPSMTEDEKQRAIEEFKRTKGIKCFDSSGKEKKPPEGAS